MKKKEFNKVIKELINRDGGMSKSSIPDGNEFNIQTGPIQKPKKDNSDFEKGVSPTTDKVRKQVSQGERWQWAFGGYGGTPYSMGNRPVGQWATQQGDFDDHDMDIKGAVDEVLEQLLKTKTDKEDLIQSKIPDELKSDKKFMDLINKIDGMDTEKKELIKTLLDNA